MKIKLSILLLLTIYKLSAQDSIPVNPETKKVSIIQVVQFENLNKSEIYQRIHDWYMLKKNSLIPSYRTKKNDKTNTPQLINIEYISFDPNNLDSLSRNRQKVAYKVVLDQQKNIGYFGPKEMSGYENANLIVLIKDNRIKIELSDFTHLPIEGMNGGKLWPYELTEVAINKKNWLLTRQQGLAKFHKFIEELIEYIKKAPRTNMDF